MSLSQYPFNWAASLAQAAANYFDASNVKPCTAPVRTAIQNVHVWDGHQRIPNTTILIEGRIISLTGDTTGANILDGQGGFLMPGLIDAHIHVSDEIGLNITAHYGVTTAFDMGSFPASNMTQWHDVGDKGLTSLLFSGAPACVSGGFPATQPDFPNSSLINSTENATNFVETRVSEGVDYLKIFINGESLPKQEFQQIIKNNAEAAGKTIVSHAPWYDAQRVARAVGGKFITHTPKEQALTKQDVQEMLDKNQVAIPTLLMMDDLVRCGRFMLGQSWEYAYCNNSVALMYEMGVPILVGTDATPPGGGLVPYRESIHEELRLLNAAGLSNEDVLRGATSLTAEIFNLTDRGVISPGKRADLLLLSADPLDDITNSDNIVQIWTAGTPVKN